MSQGSVSPKEAVRSFDCSYDCLRDTARVSLLSHLVIDLVTYSFFFYFLAVPRSLWDVSSLTRD